MIFDVNVGLGRFAGSRGRYFSTPEELLSTMNQHGISMALVYSTLAREIDYQRGNALLFESIKSESRLIPCWVAVPSDLEFENLIDKMKESGVKALRLFPNSGHFSIRPWSTITTLARLMEREQMLLVIDFENSSWSNSSVDWEGVYQLCNTFKKLNIIICGVMVAAPANYRGLIERCQNLHIEISQLASPGEIPKLIKAGFEDKIIFGTDLPSRHPGNVLTMLKQENISKRSYQKIVSGNILRLLQLNSEFPVVAELNTSYTGCIIDSHTHLGAWDHSASGSGKPEAIINEMDRCGITSSILTSIWSCYGEVALGNKAVADASAAYPGRLYGYLTVDPKYPKEVQNEIDKYRDNSNFIGVKLHCGLHAYPLIGSEVGPILEYANSKAIPVLVHSGYNPDEWNAVCSRYPNAKFIVAHLGGCGPDMPFALELAKLAGRLDNLYFDIASSKAFYGFLEELVALAGSNKVLFGSDHPLFDFGYELGQVLHSELSMDDKIKILSTNAQTIFKINITPKQRKINDGKCV